MFLRPKQTKYKKIKKGKLGRLEFKSNDLKFGNIGLKAIDSGFISSRQIESARQAISRKIKRKGKIWIKIFPDLPITSKSIGSRMGKGKGQVSHWTSRIKGGNILFEVSGKNLTLIAAALKTGGAKLPIKTKIIT